MLAMTFASPVLISEFPPVLKLLLLSPVFAERSRVLCMSAVFDWVVVLLVV